MGNFNNRAENIIETIISIIFLKYILSLCAPVPGYCRHGFNPELPKCVGIKTFSPGLSQAIFYPNPASQSTKRNKRFSKVNIFNHVYFTEKNIVPL